LSDGNAAFHHIVPGGTQNPPEFTLEQFGVINNRSFGPKPTRPTYERANAYVAPNNYMRGPGFGIPESFDCKNTGLAGNGQQTNPVDPDPSDPSKGAGPT